MFRSTVCQWRYYCSCILGWQSESSPAGNIRTYSPPTSWPASVRRSVALLKNSVDQSCLRPVRLVIKCRRWDLGGLLSGVLGRGSVTQGQGCTAVSRDGMLEGLCLVIHADLCTETQHVRFSRVHSSSMKVPQCPGTYEIRGSSWSTTSSAYIGGKTLQFALCYMFAATYPAPLD